MKYVCELCGSVYDEDRGDARNGIRPGTVFAELPADYECPGCGYEKEAFHPIGASGGTLQTQSHSRVKLRK